MPPFSQQQKDIYGKKFVRIKMVADHYVISIGEYQEEFIDEKIFDDIEQAFKFIKDHYGQLKEDIKIAKLTE